MLATKVFSTVFPVFFLIGLGYLFGRLRKIDLASLTDVVIYVASPCLAFSALSKSVIPLKTFGVISLSVLSVILGMGILTTIFLQYWGKELRGLYLPIMFPNAGNMSMPLCLFAFGEEGLALAVIFFTTSALVQYTLGVAIVSRGAENASEAFRMPMMYTAIAGVMVSFLGWEVPVYIARPVEIMGTAGIGFMLFSLGYRLVSVRLRAFRTATAAAVLRIGGGFALAWTLATFLGLEGTARGVLILGSSMPSAVINFIFAQKFNKNPELVASTVWVSTVLSVATTPTVLAFLL
ncbi:MAG: AEC family transporter [Nitrospinota bacterium]